MKKIQSLFLANYIIQTSNKLGFDINNLKLRHLLYLAQVRYFEKTSNTLFTDTVKLGKYGPLIEKPYSEYRRFGAFSLKNQHLVEEIVKFLFNENTNEISEISEEYYDPADIPADIKNLLEQIVRENSHRDGWETYCDYRRSNLYLKNEDAIKRGIMVNISPENYEKY